MAEANTKRQVYVRCNGRALRTTADEIADFFSSCGKPSIIANKHGEETQGDLHELVLVTFKKNKAVDKALALSGQQLSGRTVVVGLNTRPPRPRGEAQSSVRVFVGNLVCL